MSARATRATSIGCARVHAGLGQTKETPGHDYRYRAWVSRDALAEGLAAIARELAYANFKSEVGSRDRERAHIYGDVWRALGSIQEGGPYST